MRGRMLLAAAKRPASRVWFSSSADGAGSEAEQAMHSALSTRLEAVHVKVTDVSGGCGSMFDIEVASPQFKGQTRVKQHRMVNEILKEEIKSMHGLTIRTMTPEQFQNK
ncbi:BolA-like protein 3 [Phytophthora boehmeriae]|uniref:BolA-like protein 3 n=1 Tax=Phytophthora boehmeriae TaxID=109152 RepID=A0A8T1WIS3_9STRA|nr:BolA-like protein 3 [Phytophthora boehmeriae]